VYAFCFGFFLNEVAIRHTQLLLVAQVLHTKQRAALHPLVHASVGYGPKQSVRNSSE